MSCHIAAEKIFFQKFGSRRNVILFTMKKNRPFDVDSQLWIYLKNRSAAFWADQLMMV